MGFSDQLEFYHKDGSSKWIDTVFMLLRDEKGQPTGVLGVGRDITDRKRAEEALKESNENISLLLHYFPNPIFIKDEDTRAVMLSHHFEKMLGKPLTQLIGKTGEELWPPELAASMRIDDEKVMKERCTIEREEVFEGRHYLTTKFPISIPNRPTMLGGYTIDITERRQSEKALHEANHKLNLLSSITRHDIRSQLMVLEGNLTLLQSKHVELGSDDHLLKAEFAAKKISAMINFTNEYESVGINAPIWQDVHELVGKASKNVQLCKISFVNDIPAGTEVFADPLILKVFHNLIDNAIRHGGKITTLHFYIMERNGSKEIVCEDNGIGILADGKKEPFIRTFKDGRGFGLFLSREILAITGITIQEMGEPGKGAKFVINIEYGYS